MFMTDVNDVKIYNLSAGKSLPDVSNSIFIHIHTIHGRNNSMHYIFPVVNRSKAAQVAKPKCRPT